VTTLLQYTPEILENTCDPDVFSTHNIDDYSRTDSWVEGAWFNHDGRQSIVFAGTKCIYESHYGADGCPGSSNGLCNENSGWVCGDDDDVGPPYRVRFWFYDPDDIAQVALGNLDAWDPQPYATFDFTPYIYDPTECNNSFTGMAYDPERGRIYISEQSDITQPGGAQSVCPLIHVFDINVQPEYLLSLTLQAPTYMVQGDSAQFVLDWDFQDTADCTFAASDSVVTRISVLALTTAGTETEIAFKTGPGADTKPPKAITYAFPELGDWDGTVMLRGRVMYTSPAACADTVYTAYRGCYVQLPE
jgi:hypothetical protein